MAITLSTRPSGGAAQKRRQTPLDAAKRRGSEPGTTRSSRALTNLFLLALIVYFVTPLWWLIVASTKSEAGLFGGTGGALWFDQDFALGANLVELFTADNGLYLTWIGNSFLYALSGGIGSTVLAVLAGYGLAIYRFRGSRVFFAVLLGAVMVPLTALVIPTFVLLSEVHLTNTVWAVILPSLLNPFGVYLMRVYAFEAVPTELLEAGRMDGASELRLFFQVALPLLRPALVTVLLLSVVATWNNYFLPLVMVNDPKLLPVTVGLGQWLSLSRQGAAEAQVWNLVVTGALVSIIPLVISFLALQRYWRGGLSLGSLK